MLKDRLILVGTPIPPNFMVDARVVGLLESWRVYANVITYYPSSNIAELGQDMIVAYAMYMKPKPTHILFVDYDVLARGNTLTKLLEHDKDIISGVYPIIQKCKIGWCLSKEEPFSPMEINDLPDNPFKAKTICNGMMLVKMEVFDKLEWPYWRSTFEKGRMKTGHDIYFCEKAREAGYDLWVDPKITCNHFKTVDLLGIAKNYMKGNK